MRDKRNSAWVEDDWDLPPSPLWMVTHEPKLTKFIGQLQHLRQELMAQPEMPRDITFSKKELKAVRKAFAKMILQGEDKLHRLCELLCHTFFTDYQLQSIVIGELVETKNTFTLMQPITRKELRNTTDIDLGTRQLKKLQVFDGKQWSRANLVANFVDYQPTALNPHNIHKITSRIKAEEEVWNKVVDEIFELDRIVKRDKALRQMSRYVKDIFGVKIVVDKIDDIRPMHAALQTLMWSKKALRQVQVEIEPATQTLQILEVKDYLAEAQQKLTGWQAIKSVVRWADKTFEIQIQSLPNFIREQEYLTQESHTSFRAKREQVRQQISQQIPLFGFYRELLQWLFRPKGASPPDHPYITIHLVD